LPFIFIPIHFVTLPCAFFKRDATVGSLYIFHTLCAQLIQIFAIEVECLCNDAYDHVQLHRMVEGQRGEILFQQSKPTIESRGDRQRQHAIVIVDLQSVDVIVYGFLNKIVQTAAVICLVPLFDPPPGFIGWSECEPVFSRFVFAHKQMGTSLPVYLAGVSMGATSVLMASELELPDNVCGIAADSAFTSPHAIWKHVSENNLHIPYALHKGGADRMCQQKIHMEAGAASTIEALKHCKVPVFFAHGTDDHFVPVEMTYENYKACASEKRLLIVPGADHCLSYLMEKENYERAAKEFWETCEQLKRI